MIAKIKEIEIKRQLLVNNFREEETINPSQAKTYLKLFRENKRNQENRIKEIKKNSLSHWGGTFRRGDLDEEVGKEYDLLLRNREALKWLVKLFGEIKKLNESVFIKMI